MKKLPILWLQHTVLRVQNLLIKFSCYQLYQLHYQQCYLNFRIVSCSGHYLTKPLCFFIKYDSTNLWGFKVHEFMTAFCPLVSCLIGVNDLPLDYILCDDPLGNNNGRYGSREEKLMKYIIFWCDNFKADRDFLYSFCWAYWYIWCRLCFCQ